MFYWFVIPPYVQLRLVDPWNPLKEIVKVPGVDCERFYVYLIGALKSNSHIIEVWKNFGLNCLKIKQILDRGAVEL